MPLTNVQKVILDALVKYGEQSIKELNVSTGYSLATLRVQLPQMVPEITIDKKRQPFIYAVAPESPELKMRNEVDIVKKQLLTKDTANSVTLQSIVMRAKTQWPDAARQLEVIARAIRELELDGKLVDTLENYIPK